jgi:hypothetical protein
MKTREVDEREKRLDEEYGIVRSEESFIGAGLMGGEGRGEENVITWHAYMQNVPANIRESGKELMEEMQKGFPASKKYFGELYDNMKVVLDPKTIANKAAESFSNMKDSFGKLREYVKNEMGADISKKFNSFISAICKSFSEFKDAAKEKMTPAFDKANKAFHDMYNAVVESKAFKQAASVGADLAKSAKEFGDGVYNTAVNKVNEVKKSRGGKS